MCIQWIMFIKLFEQLIFVLLLFLSRRTFDTGWSGSMEMDETPQRQSGFTPTAQSPSREAVLTCSTCRQTKLPQNLIRNKHWTLFEMGHWPASRIFIVYCKCLQSTDESWRQKKTRISLRTTTNELPETKEKSGLIFLYLISWYLILIKLIWFFKFPL